MSSYLDNLVVRTLDLAPVAQPRLASLFESYAVLGRTSMQAPAPGESYDFERARSADGPPATQELHTTLQMIQPQPADNRGINSSPKREELTESTSIEKREVTPGSPVVEGIRAVVTSHRTQNQLERTPERTVPEPTTRKNVEVRTDSKHQSTPVIPEARTNERDRLWRKLEPRVRQIVRDELPPVDSPEENSGKGAQVIQPPVVLAPLTPKYEFHAPAPPRGAVVSNRRDSPTPAAPEITVTIERVDVRAVVTPSAQSSRRDSPRIASPSSLDKYLKERSEGRR